MSRQPVQPGHAQQQQQSRVAAALQQSRRGGAAPPPSQQLQQSRNSPPRQQMNNMNNNAHNNGMRPFQLRQSPAQQGQLVQQPNQQGRPRHQQIPTLQVTVPPPTHAPSSQQQQQYQPVSPSPLAGGGNRGPPRAAYGAPYQHQSSPTSPFSGSQDTLIGSSEGHHNNKYGGGKFSSSSSDGAHDTWSPGSSVNGAPGSPSIRNLQLVTNHAMVDRLADPENDRLMPATPSRNDFWKRFSTVMHENERKEGNIEKIAGKANAKTEKRARSSWLGKEHHRQRNYRIWVGVVGFLIIAGIAGGVGYHYATKGESQATTNPTSHDFGLGSGDTSTLPDASDASTALLSEAEATDLPAPSLVQPGATLDKRFAPMAQITAAPNADIVPLVPVRMGAVQGHWSRHAPIGQKRAALEQSLHHMD